MSTQVIVALIGVPSSLILAVTGLVQARAAARNSRQTREDIATNHGKRPGEYLELIHSDVQEIRMMLVDHITDREAHRF